MRRESKVIELWPRIGTSTGLHLLGEWYGCGGPRALLENALRLQRLCLFATRRAGLSMVGYLFHQFAPTGVAGAVLLSESHLAIHTWPAERAAMLALFVGTHTRNSRVKALALYAYLREGLLPEKENLLQVAVGGLTDIVPMPG